MGEGNGNPLVTKLSAFVDLTPEDQEYIKALCGQTRRVSAGRTLIDEGDRPEAVFLLLDGWGFRFKVLADGKRQIMAFLVPGDLCDIHIFILKEMDHSIGLLSDATVAVIPCADMLRALEERPAIARALFWATLVDEATLREWLVNMGQRDAHSRLAHLFCELWVRLKQVGLTSADGFTLPLTQEEIGDTLGLTTVHTNRMVQRLRAEGLISLSRESLTIHDPRRLAAVAGFDPTYLHLNRRN